MDKTITIQFVNGGFILHSSKDEDSTGFTAMDTEVFVSQGKLVKKVRDLVDQFSLVKKVSADEE